MPGPLLRLLEGAWAGHGGTMADPTLTLKAPDGHTIHVHCWLPQTPARAVMVVAHGMAEHAARYARLAAELNAAGIAVYAPDHRGHGLSAALPGDLGYAGPDGWNAMLEDLHQVRQHAQAQHADAPLLLLGHSMGSFLVQHYLIVHGDGVAACVLSASSGKPPAIAKVGILIARLEAWRLGQKGKSNLIHTLSFSAFNKPFAPARTDFDWLSRDSAEVDKYIADPWCGFVCTASLWGDFLVGLQFVAKAANQARIPKGLPVYVISGALDPVSEQTRGLGQLLEAYRAAGLRVQHTFYPQARHELINETNRDEVTKDLVAFVDQCLATAKAA